MKLTKRKLEEIGKKSIHPRMLVNAGDRNRVLIPAKSNRKVGNGRSIISIGKWLGMPAFTLTLEERATCPVSCVHWDDCYGNGMGFAKRVRHGKPLEIALEKECREHASIYPNGYAVRLHILGDFYSVRYVEHWRFLLEELPQLHVWGYTARKHGKIAEAIQAIREDYPERWWMRVSTEEEIQGAIQATTERGLPGFVCPEQKGMVQSCIDCAACWQTHETVIFEDH